MSEKEINKWKYSTYNALKQKMGTMNNVAQKPMNEMQEYVHLKHINAHKEL